MDDVFQAASALKSAQLANKPGRREWELAPAFMRHTCGEYPEVLDARKKPFPERLACAQELKKKGGEEYKREDWPEALSLYSKSISVFLWFQRGKDRSIEIVPLISEIPAEDSQERNEVTRHLCVCFTNASMCLANQGLNDDAIYACNKALEFNPRSEKTYYRRALSYHAKDTSTCLELAVKDLRIASRLAPCNLYTEGDLLACKEIATPPDAGLFEPPFSNDAKEKARKMGIDLDDPRVQRALKKMREENVIKKSERAKKEMPAEGSEATRRSVQEGKETKEREKTKYGFFSVMLDRSRWFSIPFFLYSALLLHFLYRMFKMFAMVSDFDLRDSDNSTLEGS
ncbi:hypothetical protein BSKO_12040 [Bryopsis sp. KO-2023]|nr:hypothetical protein BSKO_12040 [Bryopsis sp. KO-2023]